MASTLDHRHFRDTNEALTQLHDIWMHSSTGYTNPLNEYQGSPTDTVQQISFGPWDIPDGHSSLGFSPSDVGAFIKQNATTNNNSSNGSSTVGSDTSGSTHGTTKHKGSKQKQHHGGGGKGGGGTKAAGAGALGNIPKLGNVPYSTTPTSGTSPTMLLLLLGGGVLVVYFIWHKLRKSKAEDKEMDKKGE